MFYPCHLPTHLHFTAISKIARQDLEVKLGSPTQSVSEFPQSSVPKTKLTKTQKGKVKAHGTSSKTTINVEDSDKEIDDKEMEAYITGGANARGDFPMNEDVTLRQDMLSRHLGNLKVLI